MPSDCQCSTACTQIVEKKVVLGSKEATRKLRKLEADVERLKSENTTLKRKLKRASVNKKDIVARLKKQLDKV